MIYRTIEIQYKPHTVAGWETYSSCRMEAARLWNKLVEIHFRIRRRHLKWPTRSRLFQWAKGRFLLLQAQSVQQIIIDFCDAVEATAKARQKGVLDAKYPWKKTRYRDVIYTNQSATLQGQYLILPNGKQNGKLRIYIPNTITLPGRIIEARLGLFKVQIICEVKEDVTSIGTTIGIDLGVNTLVATTDGEKSVLVSGRQVKSIIQGRNKFLAEFSSSQSKKIKGSIRWKRLQRKKQRMLAKAKRRIKDACHKATRQVANAFPNAKCYVGEPFNDAAVKLNRVQAQTVSQACNSKIIFMLDYKTAGAIQVEEHYTSQTCPVCGVRSKHRRIFRCKCGVIAPRDVIGAVNIRNKGIFGEIKLGQEIPKKIKYLHPIGCNSPGGHPASCS